MRLPSTLCRVGSAETWTGPEPAGADWTLESITFALGGPTVSFRFEYAAGGSFTGDLGIDDVVVQ